jgi:SAM-dependent methyltransferase/uncharacterized protein YbaR (Trm112 family)
MTEIRTPVHERSAASQLKLDLARFADLGKIVVCPTSRSPLRLVGRDELKRRVEASDEWRIGPDVVGAFVSEESGRAYAVQGPVVNFLPAESLRLKLGSSPQIDSARVDSSDEAKSSVRRWYDEFGWQTNEQGMYYDSAVFSQNAPVGNGLYELLSHLRVLERLSGGEWLVDAASGAIAHPEYLTYSWFYTRRVCVDFSITALHEAAKKLRATDYCCQADICQLPFRDGVFEGGISGYTIQHIPDSQQETAVRELYRVLSPNSHLCFFTDVEIGRAHDIVRRAIRACAALVGSRPSRRERPLAEAAGGAPNAPSALYFRARSTAWWRDLAGSLTPSSSVETLRLLTRNEFRGVFGESNRAARVLDALESCFPKALAFASAYCLVDLRKPSTPVE